MAVWAVPRPVRPSGRRNLLFPPSEPSPSSHILRVRRKAGPGLPSRVNRVFGTQEQVVVHALSVGGFAEEEAQRVWHNLRGAVNQAAYVLGAFRREISDVHGASSAAPAVVQRALDAAAFIVRSLLG